MNPIQSTPIVPNRRVHSAPMAKFSIEPPDLNTIGGRLRWAREAAHFTSARSAAQANGWNENTYKSHEQGLRQAEGFKQKYIDRYTRAFHVNALWLTTGKGPPQRDAAEAAWQEMTPEERERAIRLSKAAG